MVEKKYIVHDGIGYSYYPCTRCLNGTMAWERDKTDLPPFLKCVLCGKEETNREKKSEEMPKQTKKTRISEAELIKKVRKIPPQKTSKRQYFSESTKLTVQKVQ